MNYRLRSGKGAEPLYSDFNNDNQIITRMLDLDLGFDLPYVRALPLILALFSGQGKLGALHTFYKP